MLPGYPLLGNLLDFMRDRHALLRRGYERFGAIFGIKLATLSVAVVVDPEFQQFFFTETDKQLRIDKPYKSLAALFGEVAFLAPHKVYLEQQPILYTPFRPEKMGYYVQIMQREVQRWVDALGTSGEIDISGEMGQLVQRIAGLALMGEDFQSKVGREFWELYADLGKTLSLVTPPNWPLPNNIRRERAKKRMIEILRPVVAERRRNPDLYDDFLQDFVTAKGRSGAPADDETVIALLRALMFASHETTAGQAAWTVIELLRHPAYLSKVQDEIAAYTPLGMPLEAKSLRSLQHVYWAVREIERLHPSADILMRTADVDVEVGDYRVPAGWNLMVSPAVAHRLPSLFSDPDEFDPLRFAPGREEDRAHGYTMIGFGGGRHKCAGMNFANNEMAVITTLILQQMELELITKNPRVSYELGAGRPERTLVRYKRKEAVLA
jgi:sterol 14-demethylase